MEKILFCAECGAFREPRSEDGRNFGCPQCEAKVAVEELSKKLEGTSSVLPIERSELLLRLSGRDTGTGAGEEAVIDEDCPKCKHPKMSYHTAQLRGVDEGQTIFYTCLNEKCRHKFTLNS